MPLVNCTYHGWVGGELVTRAVSDLVNDRGNWKDSRRAVPLTLVRACEPADLITRKDVSMALATAIYRMSAKGFRCQTIITSPSDHSFPPPVHRSQPPPCGCPMVLNQYVYKRSSS
ncbi:hypothetical protein DIE18_13710 [Burkholderia sp. Bp9125]|nr:hypothetical protein DIE18_13710 [Burkholderia sp. Bp9125]